MMFILKVTKITICISQAVVRCFHIFDICIMYTDIISLLGIKCDMTFNVSSQGHSAN